MKNVCLILTSSVVCAFIVYYSWTLYSEVKILKSTLAELEQKAQNTSNIQMNIENVQKNEYDESEHNCDADDESVTHIYQEDTSNLENTDITVEWENNESNEGTFEEEGNETDNSDENENETETYAENNESDEEDEEVEEEEEVEEVEMNEEVEEIEMDEEDEHRKSEEYVSLVSDNKTKNELIRLLKDHNLSVYGNKKVLIQRLMTLDNFETVLNL